MYCIKNTLSKLDLHVFTPGRFKIWYYTIVISAICFVVSSNTTELFRYKGPEFTRTSHEFFQNSSFSSPYSMRSEISLGLKLLAKKFSLRLKEISESELGLSHLPELTKYEKNDPAELDELGRKFVKRLSRRLDSKLTEYLLIINQTITTIANFANKYGHQYFTEEPCLFISLNRTADHSSIIPRAYQTFQDSFFATLNLTEDFVKNINANLAIKLQFFISSVDGVEQTHVYRNFQLNSTELIDNKCSISVDPFFQKIFLKTVSKLPKHIVLIVDHGSVFSQNQISSAKSLAKHIISALSFEDKVGLFGLAETVTSADTIDCSETFMSYATEKNKVLFINFIDTLTNFKGKTNHSLGFQAAFNMIKHSVKDASKEVIIIYISRGLLSSLPEAKVVMETISAGKDSVLPNVIINTCLLIDEGKTLFEKHFLRFVSQQNFTNYNIKNERSKLHGGLTPGVMQFINSSTYFDSVVYRLCVTNTLNTSREEGPHWEVNKGGDIVLTISQPVHDFQKKFLGITGLDVSFEDVFENVLYFNDIKKTYAFVIDLKGYVWVHPLLKQQPNYGNYEQSSAVDISYLEIRTGFAEVRGALLSNTSGSIHLSKSQIMYSWQRLHSAPLVVVLAISTQMTFAQIVHNIVMPPDIALAYHRLDLSPMTDEFSLCWNLRQLSSLDTGSLFLSALCFQSPMKYLSAVNNETWPNVQSYMAYLKDNTKLLANPGLKSWIRSDIIPIVDILRYWKKLFIHSTLSKYIVRRYISTSSGAVLMYPGAVIDPKLNPLKRYWYVEAMQRPEEVVLTPPYLDSGGAGYIVTISQALKNPVTAVVAMDITLGYMYKLLVENIPFCTLPDVQSSNNTKCFIMDNKGYLITHPNLIGKEMLEKQHITHMESLLANDMLNHKGFVQKLVCNDYSSSTIQRYYEFNMNGSGIISNMIPGDQCVRYHLIPLHGTNIFLGIINTTCDLVTAFCPCNTVDRHCLNCDRLEQSECECPCECPLEAESCGKVEPNLNPPCFNYADPPAHILPMLTKVKVRTIPRPLDVPDSGLVCDLLWGDPDEGVIGWGQNDRGVSYVFGGDVVRSFLRRHNCSLIVRAHQVVEDGYQFFSRRNLLTLFSAPNYCGEFDNAGAVMSVSEDLTCCFSILPPEKKKVIRFK